MALHESFAAAAEKAGPTKRSSSLPDSPTASMVSTVCTMSSRGSTIGGGGRVDREADDDEEIELVEDVDLTIGCVRLVVLRASGPPRDDDDGTPCCCEVTVDGITQRTRPSSSSPGTLVWNEDMTFVSQRQHQQTRTVPRTASFRIKSGNGALLGAAALTLDTDDVLGERELSFLDDSVGGVVVRVTCCRTNLRPIATELCLARSRRESASRTADHAATRAALERSERERRELTRTLHDRAVEEEDRLHEQQLHHTWNVNDARAAVENATLDARVRRAVLTELETNSEEQDSAASTTEEQDTQNKKAPSPRRPGDEGPTEAVVAELVRQRTEDQEEELAALVRRTEDQEEETAARRRHLQQTERAVTELRRELSIADEIVRERKKELHRDTTRYSNELVRKHRVLLAARQRLSIRDADLRELQKKKVKREALLRKIQRVNHNLQIESQVLREHIEHLLQGGSTLLLCDDDDADDRVAITKNVV